ncbi:hypothetical protein TrST_g5942 [Triparma strigata]|uniref:Mannan endo-1,6-alpha-mannosidase n=1 Tax=Triparma strigata TaxID=1606541 RepID=A0A9W7ETA8_9STRA|nr:hypothetical protein TrST_g5942 [Triparma strigata]
MIGVLLGVLFLAANGKGVVDASPPSSQALERLQTCYPASAPAGFGTVGMEHPQLWTSAWWQDALALQASIEAIDDDDAKSSLCADVASRENAPWENTFETSSDDQLWWTLSWISCSPYSSEYLYRSKALHFHVLETWNSGYCGGGVLWDSSLTYKNAITNALLILSSCEIFKVTEERQYLQTAIKTWEWFAESGMINSDNLVVDGLTEDCNPTGDPFSYNSGILIHSLSSLYEITNDKVYLANATFVANAALERFQSSDAPGILADDCCKSVDDCDCNHDGISFHGILARSLAAFVKAGGDVDGNVASVLKFNAETAWDNRDADTNQIGIAWEGAILEDMDPNDACVAQTAGIQLLTAAGM